MTEQQFELMLKAREDVQRAKQELEELYRLQATGEIHCFRMFALSGEFGGAFGPHQVPYLQVAIVAMLTVAGDRLEIVQNQWKAILDEWPIVNIKRSI
jgi:hypothetical protein